MDNSVQLLKRKYNIYFFSFLFVISFSVLALMIFLLLINSPDHLNLKRPTPYLLLPIYLVVRLIFLRIELKKNISINKAEEAIKLLLFIYFLTILSLKIFPLDKYFDSKFLAINFLSTNTFFSIKTISKTLIENLILFIPLGFFLPMIENKFMNISNCIISSISISVAIDLLQILLHSIDIYVVDIISLDVTLVSIISTFIGYKIYNFIVKINLKKYHFYKVIFISTVKDLL